MPTTADLLTIIDEKAPKNIKQLAKHLEIPTEKLHTILTDLNKHNLIEYDPKTGKVTLPKWLANIDQKIEAIKPTTGTIILPKYQEMQIQDVLIGNYTKEDIELKIRLRRRLKEIAICPVT